MIKSVYRAAAMLVLCTAASAQEGTLTDWAGQWSAGEEQFITIEASKKSLAIVGTATWGGTDPERIASGGVNMGEFDVRVPKGWIEGDRVVFTVGDEGAEPIGMVADDYACIIEMALEGEVLLVGDNGMCGGLNVTFSGEYRRGR